MRRRAAHRAALLIAPREKAGGGIEGGFYLRFVWLENGYDRGRAALDDLNSAAAQLLLPQPPARRLSHGTCAARKV